MELRELMSLGWEFKSAIPGQALFEKGIHRMQYLHEKQACYISELDEAGSMVIYRGKCENYDQLRLIMDLLWIK